MNMNLQEERLHSMEKQMYRGEFDIKKKTEKVPLICCLHLGKK